MSKFLTVRLEDGVKGQLEALVAKGAYPTVSAAVKASIGDLLAKFGRQDTVANAKDAAVTGIVVRAVQAGLVCGEHTDFKPRTGPEGRMVGDGRLDVVLHTSHLRAAITESRGADVRTLKRWTRELQDRGLVVGIHQVYAQVFLVDDGGGHFLPPEVRRQVLERARASADVRPPVPAAPDPLVGTHPPG